eukprot:COSAG06_NODE_5783_length_3275_cov_18728.487406_2_plen_39_part_00
MLSLVPNPSVHVWNRYAALELELEARGDCDWVGGTHGS